MPRQGYRISLLDPSILIVWAILLASCSQAPQARVDGRPTTPQPAEEVLPEPLGSSAGELTAPPEWVPGADLVRIGLRSGTQELRLDAKVAVKIETLDGSRLASSGAPGELHLLAVRGGIQLSAPGLGPSVLGESVLLVRGLANEVGFEFKDNEYAGHMVVRRERNGTLTLINLIDLESYLRGVVPWEIGRPGLEALEAVKAQAIAARTYTVSHLGRREASGFDLWDSVEDQVYRGMTGIHPVTDRAVFETRDRVLRSNGDLVQAYYSSTCGGHTAAIQDVWKREAIPYLQGGRDAPANESAWCRESPHFRWTMAWSAHELGEVLRKNLPAELETDLNPRDFGVLQGLEVLEYDRSGRVQRLLILTDQGNWIVRGDRIRWVLRPVRGRFPILRSTLFRLEEFHDEEGDLIGIRLQGGGFGHGIGMCQTGALAMARAGRRADQILEHYYPQTRLDDLSGSRQDWTRD